MAEENIFFDTSKLKYRGNNVIIGKTVRIRYPELVELHDNVIIDDFVHISAELIMQEHSFIESHVSIMGGKDYQVRLGKHAGIGGFSALRCVNVDYHSGIQLNHCRDLLKFDNQGDIILEDHVLIGCHNSLFGGITLGEGVRTAEYTRITHNLEPWQLYYGASAKKIGPVDKDSVLRELQKYHDYRKFEK
jgi:acetyltransferase-like isoleucine patch superfamily enzyme